MKTLIKLSLITIIVFSLSACMEEKQTEKTPAEPEALQKTEQIGDKHHKIEIKDFAFVPQHLTIKEGDTVVWINLDGPEHTITSDSGKDLDSPYLGKNKSYSHVFNSTGTYLYHCTPHPYMKGKIIVNK